MWPFTFCWILLAVLSSCCHHGSEDLSQPVTNNPKVINCKEEWTPDPNEPWWKSTIQQTCENLAEENANNS
jgi:hypothetical protein